MYVPDLFPTNGRILRERLSFQSVTLKVECTKLTCPALSCADSEAYRPDPMACCKQCPSQPTTPPTTAISATATKDILILGEEAQMRGESDILSSGGCRFKGDVFENGEEWHPRIQPWGEMRCINCNCKVGAVLHPTANAICQWLSQLSTSHPYSHDFYSLHIFMDSY